MSVICIYEHRIVFSNVTTEATVFVLLIQVERVDEFFGDQHMRKIPLPFTVEATNVTCKWYTGISVDDIPSLHRK